MLVRKKGGREGGENSTLFSSLSVPLPLPSALDSPQLLSIFRIQCCSHTSKKICPPEESAWNWILWVLPTVITRSFASSPLSCFRFTHPLHIYIHFILLSGLKCNFKRVATLILAGHVFKYNKAGATDLINIKLTLWLETTDILWQPPVMTRDYWYTNTIKLWQPRVESLNDFLEIIVTVFWSSDVQKDFFSHFPF